MNDARRKRLNEIATELSRLYDEMDSVLMEECAPAEYAGPHGAMLEDAMSDVDAGLMRLRKVVAA